MTAILQLMDALGALRANASLDGAATGRDSGQDFARAIEASDREAAPEKDSRFRSRQQEENGASTPFFLLALSAFPPASDGSAPLPADEWKAPTKDSQSLASGEKEAVAQSVALPLSSLPPLGSRSVVPSTDDGKSPEGLPQPQRLGAPGLGAPGLGAQFEFSPSGALVREVSKSGNHPLKARPFDAAVQSTVDGARPDMAPEGAAAIRRMATGAPSGVRSQVRLAAVADAAKEDARSARSPDATEGVERSSTERPAGGVPESNPSFGAEGRIHISHLGAHLPVALGRVLPQAAGPQAHLEATHARPASLPEVSRHETIKVLTFQVEPEGMGAISVRMKLSQTRVELRIDTQAAAVSHTLSDAREALSRAIGDKGLALEAYEVRLLPSAPTTTVEAAPPREGAGYFGQDFSHGDGSRQRHKPESRAAALRRREDVGSSIGPSGVIL